MLIADHEGCGRAEEALSQSIDDEIARIDAEIERLRVRREAFVDMRAMMAGKESPPSVVPKQPRKRSVNVKPLVLDIMKAAGPNGHTSAEVKEMVKTQIPTVNDDTVASVLSRLRADNALRHDGERYYDVQFAPPSRPLFEGSSAVN